MDNIKLGFNTQTVQSGPYSTFAIGKVRRVHIVVKGSEPQNQAFSDSEIQRSERWTMPPVHLTRTLLGGGRGEFEHPLQFFENGEKTAARSAAFFTFFYIPYQPSFPQLSWKFCSRVISGQVKWPYLIKVYDATVATVFERSIWNFKNIIWPSVAIKLISWIFNFGDVKSVQFCDLPFCGLNFVKDIRQ